MRRQARIEQIVARLNALGICLDGEKLGGGMPLGATPGRMHVARGLVTLGYAASVQEAFDRYLNPGRPAHVPRSRPSCEQAIEVIHEANGLAFLAHPGIGAAARLLDRLLALSFDGLEAYHCKHSPGQVQEFTELARARGLLVAGGSDCHGGAKSEPELGKVRVPHKYYERICSVLEARGRPSH